MAKTLEGFELSPTVPAGSGLHRLYLQPAADAVAQMVINGDSTDDIERRTGLRITWPNGRPVFQK